MRSKYEIKAQKELEAEGYRVDNKAGMSRFAKNRDFFNLFDLIALKPGESPGVGTLRWISIKGHNRGSKEHHAQLAQFKLPWGNVKELWIWPNNKKKKAWIKKIII